MRKFDYDLYQVKRGEEHVDLLFTRMSMIQKLNLKIEQSHYDKVYSGTVDSAGSPGEALESLFMKFNLEFPADYRGRSMSVSDVVVLHENGVDTAYFCDSIGFAEVPQFLQTMPVVTMATSGLAADEHFGTWHTIDTQTICGRDFYLMEHDEFDKEVANIIVDGTGKVAAEDVWNGFSPEIIAMIMDEHGLTPDQAAPTREPSGNAENYLAAAEGYSEENYNMIDGRIDTQSKLTPGDDTESQPEHRNEKKPSALAKLKQNQAKVSATTKDVSTTARRSTDISLD